MSYTGWGGQNYSTLGDIVDSHVNIAFWAILRITYFVNFLKKENGVLNLNALFWGKSKNIHFYWPTYLNILVKVWRVRHISHFRLISPGRKLNSPTICDDFQKFLFCCLPWTNPANCCLSWERVEPKFCCTHLNW